MTEVTKVQSHKHHAFWSDAHMEDLDNLPLAAQQIIEHLTEGNSKEELAIMLLQSWTLHEPATYEALLKDDMLELSEEEADEELAIL